jgi:hypothetical protein
MSRRTLLLLAALLAVAVLAAAGIGTSSATFTTSSTSTVTASVDRVSNWLYLYSQASLGGTDPDGQNGYAQSRGLNGVPGSLAASGLNEALQVDLGDFPDRNATYSFPRVFSIKTPATFPNGFAGPITVDLTLLPDPVTGDAMLQNGSLTPFGETGRGGGKSVTLAAGTKYQFNVSVRARKRFQLSATYSPRVRLSLTIAGVADSFVYEIPVQVTDAGGS